MGLYPERGTSLVGDRMDNAHRQHSQKRSRQHIGNIGSCFCLQGVLISCIHPACQAGSAQSVFGMGCIVAVYGYAVSFSVFILQRHINYIHPGRQKSIFCQDMLTFAQEKHIRHDLCARVFLEGVLGQTYSS